MKVALNSYMTMTMLCLVLTAGHAWAQETTLIPRTGGGYMEVTTDRLGRDLQVTRKTEDGRVIDSVETNPDTGTRATTRYNDAGRPESRTTVNRDGVTTKSEILDEQGRAVDTQTYSELGEFESHTTTEFGEDGEITRTQTLDGTGQVVEETHFLYDKEGNLENAMRRKRNAKGDLVEDGQTFYDDSGNLVESMGNIDGITDDLPDSGNVQTDTSRSTMTDTAGNTYVIIHNADGSMDVIVRDRYGRIISLQYYSTGGHWPHEETLQHLQRTMSDQKPRVVEKATHTPTTESISFDPESYARGTDVSFEPYGALGVVGVLGDDVIGNGYGLDAGVRVPLATLLGVAALGGWSQNLYLVGGLGRRSYSSEYDAFDSITGWAFFGGLGGVLWFGDHAVQGCCWGLRTAMPFHWGWGADALLNYTSLTVEPKGNYKSYYDEETSGALAAIVQTGPRFLFLGGRLSVELNAGGGLNLTTYDYGDKDAGRLTYQFGVAVGYGL